MQSEAYTEGKQGIHREIQATYEEIINFLRVNFDIPKFLRVKSIFLYCTKQYIKEKAPFGSGLNQVKESNFSLWKGKVGIQTNTKQAEVVSNHISPPIQGGMLQKMAVSFLPTVTLSLPVFLSFSKTVYQLLMFCTTNLAKFTFPFSFLLSFVGICGKIHATVRKWIAFAVSVISAAIAIYISLRCRC